MYTPYLINGLYPIHPAMKCEGWHSSHLAYVEELLPMCLLYLSSCCSCCLLLHLGGGGQQVSLLCVCSAFPPVLRVHVYRKDKQGFNTFAVLQIRKYTGIFNSLNTTTIIPNTQIELVIFHRQCCNYPTITIINPQYDT